MAVTFDQGVLLGADSRTTSGVFIPSKVSDKIEPIHRRIFCLRSGNSAHTQTISRYVRHYLNMQSVEEGSLPQVSTAAKLFASICYSNKNFLQASVICAGWDEVQGGQVYEIPLGGSLMKEPYAIGGSGSSYIYGFCDANWRENMSLTDAKAFVIKALSLAINRDGGSGGVIRLTTVTPAEVTREWVPREEHFRT